MSEREQEDDLDELPAPKVLNAPKRIWLNVGDLDEDADFHDLGEVTWCDSKQESADVEYVQAALADRPEQPVALNGWRLVPEEMTPDMAEAAHDKAIHGPFTVWRAILAAAPVARPEPLEQWRDDELADSPTPKAQEGTWTLTAPDGRTWQADSPLRCAGAEQNDRVPPDVQLARIARSIADVPQEPAQPVALVRTQRYGKPVLPYAEWTDAVMDAPLKDGSPLYATPPSHPAPSEAGAERQEHVAPARTGEEIDGKAGGT